MYYWQMYCTAMAFLTRFPLVHRFANWERLGESVIFFPLVGATLGILVGWWWLALDWLFPGHLTGALALAVTLMLTGGLHLDGLMDSSDGLFSGRNREGILEVMRDSRVGAHGVTAAIILMLIKYSVLSTMDNRQAIPFLITAFTTGRWAMVFALGWFPAARPDGLAHHLKKGLTPLHLVASTVLTVAVAGIVVFPFGLAMAGLAGLMAWWIGNQFTARIGGMTGDNCGAILEIVETAVLVTLMAFAP